MLYLSNDRIPTNHVSLLRLTQPSSDDAVLTLREAKSHLNEDQSSTERDDEIGRFIAGARAAAEDYCSRAWVSSSWALLLDFLPVGPVALPPDVGSVASVTYRDELDDLVTVDPATYRLDAERCQLLPKDGWPAGSRQARVELALQPAFVPPPVKSAVKLIMADLYATREASIQAQTYVVNPAVENLLYPYRVSLGM